MNLFDLTIYNFIYSFYSTPFTMFMRVISSLASPIVIITALLCIFLLFKDRRIFLQFFTLTLFTKVINVLIKNIIQRPRPSLSTTLSIETGYSFPSAHTMVATVFFGFIIYLVVKNVKNKKLRNYSVALLSLIIFLIGISRIYLGVHYATDVIGGFIIGLLILFIFIKLVYKKSNKNISLEFNDNIKSSNNAKTNKDNKIKSENKKTNRNKNKDKK